MASGGIPEDPAEPKLGSIILSCDRDKMLRDGFNKFWNNKVHADIDIMCREDCFPAHKVLLASQSGYFERQLDPSQHKGKSISSLTIDADPRILLSCLEFMYSGKIEVHPGQLQGITQLSEQLSIQQLHRICRSMEFRDIVADRSNCLSMLCVGRAVGDVALVKKAQPLARANFIKLTSHNTFHNLCMECVKELVNDEKLFKTTPQQLLTATLAWVHHDLSTRQQNLLDLLKALPLMRMEPWMIEPFVSHVALQGQPECQALLNEAISALEEGVDEGQEGTESTDSGNKRVYLVTMTQRRMMGDSYRDATNEVTITDLSQPNDARQLTKLLSAVPADGRIACCVSGSTLTVSGTGDGRDECWSYDSVRSVSVWRECGVLNVSRLGHCMAVCEGVVYVLAGHQPKSSDWSLVSDVEVHNTEREEWQVTGKLHGKNCYAACCCSHQGNIIVYGVYEGNGNHLLQVFSPSQRCVTSHITLPSSKKLTVYGVALVQNTVIMIGSQDTYVIPVESLLQGDATRLTTCYIYRSPNIGCVMAVFDDDVLLFGGRPRDDEPDHFLYRAPVTNLLQNIGSSWTRVTPDWSGGKCRLYTGACCTATLSPP